jgi:hypothetical protein
VPTEGTKAPGSEKAKKNKTIMSLLQAELEANPELGLTIALYRISQQMIAPKKNKPPPKKMDFYQKLMNHAKEVEIAYPL